MALRDVAMTEKVAGNDNALHARNKNEPTNKAIQLGQTKTKT